MLQQHAAKRLVGQDAGEIVDAAIALGLADDGDDLVGAELTGPNQCLEPARVLNCLQFDFCNFNRHSPKTPLSPDLSQPRPVLAAQHLFIALAAVNHR